MHHKFGWNTQGVYLCGAKTLEKRANGVQKWYRTVYIAPLWYTKWRNSKFSTSPESSLKLLKAREIGRLCRPKWHGDGACGIHL